MIEKVIHKNRLYAYILRSSYKKKGIHFFTERRDTMQMGHISYKSEHKILAHHHPLKKKLVNTTSEALIIKKGIIKVKFYDERNSKKIFKSKILKKGDVILILRGGHGFEIIKNVEMIEIKQGPFIEKNNKVRLKK